MACWILVSQAGMQPRPLAAESEVKLLSCVQLFVTPWTIHGVLQARTLGWVAISFSRGIFLTQGWNPRLLLGRQILYH